MKQTTSLPLGRYRRADRRRSSSSGAFGGRHILLGCLLLVFILGHVSAAPLNEARISQVVREVTLLARQAPPRPAAVPDEVRDGTAVRTGVQSRAELTFTDRTLARG